MKTILTIAAALAATVGTTAAEAQVNQRQWQQQQRIYAGVRQHQIGRGEYARLQRQQARIAGYERVSRRDGGGLSGQERARLNRMQNRASRAIYNQRHDRTIAAQPVHW
jgi:hypothetical protein